MDPLGRSHFALRVCAAVALLAGCGGGSQLGSSPIQPDAFPTRASWMAPKGKQGDLAYVGGFYGVSAFTYPSFKYVYSIAGDDAQGLCAAKNGDWWVVESGADEVSEYAHGGTTPLKTLSVPGGEAAGCAVDPTTGTLAVTILGSGDAVVFTGGYGRGTTIADDLDSSYFDGYDDKGDLFVDGITSSDTYGVVELPKGAIPSRASPSAEASSFPAVSNGTISTLRLEIKRLTRFIILPYVVRTRKRSALPTSAVPRMLFSSTFRSRTLSEPTPEMKTSHCGSIQPAVRL
ncbi:MAG: hypothetical protein WAM02_11925 [Candidatus Cybelea sp.]